MRIGIDIDDVLIDLNLALRSFHNDNYDTIIERKDFKTFNLWGTWGGTREEAIEKVAKFYDSDYFKLAKPTGDIKKKINFLSRRHTLFIITSRHSKVVDFTKEWLMSHFGDIFQNIFFTNHFDEESGASKDEICVDNDIDLLIEDNKDWAMASALKGVFVLLLDAPWNQDVEHENIKRVYSWDEIVEEIERMEAKNGK